METITQKVTLNSSRSMPLIGFGTAGIPPLPSRTKQSVLDAIAVGHRHFDTASFYQSEKPLGEAIVDAIDLGLISSRDDVFVTSKLWCCDAQRDLVVPALRQTLRTLGMDYVDLYLIHFPLCTTPCLFEFPIKAEDVLPLDLKSVWAAMEECQNLGLTKSVGVSNFSCKKLDELLSMSNIPPAVNQVEVNPLWQQNEMRKYCKEKGIHVVAYSPLGGQTFTGSTNQVMDCEVLEQIAMAKGKTNAQVSLRWVYEQGVGVIVKSYKKERILENIQIFGWALSKEENAMIDGIPQRKKLPVELWIDGELPPETMAEIADGVM